MDRGYVFRGMTSLVAASVVGEIDAPGNFAFERTRNSAGIIIAR